MNIKKITDGQNVMGDKKHTPVSEEALQGEFDYRMAEKMLKKLLENGLISKGEYTKIDKLNRLSFSPLYVQIMP